MLLHIFANAYVTFCSLWSKLPRMYPCFCQRASHLRYRCKLAKVYADVSCRKFHLPRQLEMQLVLEAWMQPVLEAWKHRPNVEELGSKKQSGDVDGAGGGSSGFGSRYGGSFFDGGGCCCKVFWGLLLLNYFFCCQIVTEFLLHIVRVLILSVLILLAIVVCLLRSLLLKDICTGWYFFNSFWNTSLLAIARQDFLLFAAVLTEWSDLIWL